MSISFDNHNHGKVLVIDFVSAIAAPARCWSNVFMFSRRAFVVIMYLKNGLSCWRPDISEYNTKGVSLLSGTYELVFAKFAIAPRLTENPSRTSSSCLCITVFIWLSDGISPPNCICCSALIYIRVFPVFINRKTRASVAGVILFEASSSSWCTCSWFSFCWISYRGISKYLVRRFL